MKNSYQSFYQKPTTLWVGRNDTPKGRLFQHIQSLDCQHLPDKLPKKSIVFLGFACDEGVKRNLGRPGAAKGPESLRQALSNTPLAVNNSYYFWDAGDVICPNQDLETAQHTLGKITAQLRQRRAHVIVLGGGHEVAFGHFQGLIEQRGLDVINFDAHFDCRPLLPNQLGSSGTGFRQMHDYCQENKISWRYACLGVQPFGNTTDLFDYATSINAYFCLAEEIVQKPQVIQEALSRWLESSQRIYLTLCLDVFAQADAPGVSAPQPMGLSPHNVLPFFRQILHSGKVIGFDVAELNPLHDYDSQTAKLGAYFIAEYCQYLLKYS